MWIPLAGLLLGILLGLVLQVSVSYEIARYTAVGIIAAVDSVLGAIRAELEGTFSERIFISVDLVLQGVKSRAIETSPMHDRVNHS